MWLLQEHILASGMYENWYGSFWCWITARTSLVYCKYSLLNNEGCCHKINYIYLPHFTEVDEITFHVSGLRLGH